MNVRCMGCMEEYDSSYDICPHCGYWAETPTEEMYHLNPGTVLYGKYIVGKVLAASGDSEIAYIGWDESLYRKVTIKEYLPKECSMRVPGSEQITAYQGEWEEQLKKGIETFISETRKLMRFQDLPTVVRTYDCFEANGTAYLVMEYLEGCTLEERLGNGRQMGMEECLELLQPVFTDLKKLHAAGCVHGDIAPNHIFITKHGMIKLLDLGAVRHVALAQDKSLRVIIKSGYAPPEQYQNHGNPGSWTDVYSLAATMYWMLTGIVPEDAMERMAEDHLQPIAKLAVHISKNQEKAIYHALQLSSKERTQTIEELEKELYPRKASRSKDQSEKKPVTIQPEEETEDEKSHGGLLLGAGAGILIIAAIVVGFFVMGNRSSTKNTVDADNTSQDISEEQIVATSVPNLILADVEEAATEVEKQGLRLIIVDTENSEEVEKGKIISQSPKAGSNSAGGNINVVVSAGTDKVVLEDNLLGYDSLETLKEDGFILTTELQESYLIPGYVVSIERGSETDEEDNTVEAGDQLPEGCALTVLESAGVSDLDTSETFVLPDLCGMNFQEALQEAENNGFYIGLKSNTVYSREAVATAGEICEMEYADIEESGSDDVTTEKAVKAGEEITKGTAILLAISKGPKMVEISESDYKGETLSTVEQLLDELYLEYDEKNYDYVYSNSYAKGTVVSVETTCHHDGISGTLHWDDTVNITVSKGPQPTTASKPTTGSFSGGSSSGNSKSGGNSTSGTDSGSSSKSGGSSSGATTNGVNEADAFSD